MDNQERSEIGGVVKRNSGKEDKKNIWVGLKVRSRYWQQHFISEIAELMKKLHSINVYPTNETKTECKN